MVLINPFEPIVLKHPDLSLTAHVIPLGVNVTRLVYKDPQTGQENDVIVGPENPRDHWEKGRKFLGPMIGRYANRLPAGNIEYEGGSVQVPEFSSPGVSLHGGPDIQKLADVEEGTTPSQKGPIDRLIFARIPSSKALLFGAESPSQPSGSTAIFAAVSQGAAPNEPGYPGLLRIEVRFALQKGHSQTHHNLGASAGALRMEYRAHLLDDPSDKCDATPVNMTHHWAFNLSASDAKARVQDSGTINKHTLLLRPTRGLEPPAGAPHAEKGQSNLWTLELDEKKVPSGNLILCAEGGPYDFLSQGESGLGRTLDPKHGPPGGHDHFYTWGIQPSGQDEMEPRAILSSPTAGVALAFSTNQAGVQVYATTGLPPAPAPNDNTTGGTRKLLHGGEDGYGNFLNSGVCLEFGAPHGTILHKQYQHLAQSNTVLSRGEQYRSFVEAELFFRH